MAFLASSKSVAINVNSIAAGGGSPGEIYYRRFCQLLGPPLRYYSLCRTPRPRLALRLTAVFFGSGCCVTGDGCAAGKDQRRLLLVAELGPIADATACGLGGADGPTADISG